jgi:hypothetical protein
LEEVSGSLNAGSVELSHGMIWKGRSISMQDKKPFGVTSHRLFAEKTVDAILALVAEGKEINFQGFPIGEQVKHFNNALRLGQIGETYGVIAHLICSLLNISNMEGDSRFRVDLIESSEQLKERIVSCRNMNCKQFEVQRKDTNQSLNFCYRCGGPMFVKTHK